MCPTPRQVDIQAEELTLLRKVVNDLKAQGQVSFRGSVLALDRDALLEILKSAEKGNADATLIRHLDNLRSEDLKIQLSARIATAFSKSSGAVAVKELESLRRIAEKMDDQHFASAERQEVHQGVYPSKSESASQKTQIRTATKEELIRMIKGYLVGEPSLIQSGHHSSIVDVDETAKRAILKIINEEVGSVDSETKKALLETLKQERVYQRVPVPNTPGNESGVLIRPSVKLHSDYYGGNEYLKLRPVADTKAMLDNYARSFQRPLSEGFGTTALEQIPLNPSGEVDFKKLEAMERKNLRSSLTNINLELAEFNRPRQLGESGNRVVVAVRTKPELESSKAKLEAILGDKTKMASHLREVAKGLPELGTKLSAVQSAFAQAAEVAKDLATSEANQPLRDVITALHRDEEVAAAIKDVQAKAGAVRDSLTIGKERSLENIKSAVSSAEYNSSKLAESQKNLLKVLKSKGVEIPKALESRLAGAGGALALGLFIFAAVNLTAERESGAKELEKLIPKREPEFEQRKRRRK